MMVTRSYAQDTTDTLSTLRDQALNIFLDFDRGDQNFIRTEITYVKLCPGSNPGRRPRYDPAVRQRWRGLSSLRGHEGGRDRSWRD